MMQDESQFCMGLHLHPGGRPPFNPDVDADPRMIGFALSPYKNYNNNDYFDFVIMMVNTQNNVQCRYMSVGQPNCTYQCRHHHMCLGVVRFIMLETIIQ
jgi:hypothetical protein